MSDNLLTVVAIVVWTLCGYVMLTTIIDMVYTLGIQRLRRKRYAVLVRLMTDDELREIARTPYDFSDLKMWSTFLGWRKWFTRPELNADNFEFNCAATEEWYRRTTSEHKSRMNNMQQQYNVQAQQRANAAVLRALQVQQSQRDYLEQQYQQYIAAQINALIQGANK